MVKLKTNLAHRFGRPIILDGQRYEVSLDGEIEVSSEEVAAIIVNRGNNFNFCSTKVKKDVVTHIVENITPSNEMEEVIITEVAKDNEVSDFDYLNDLTRKQLEDVLIEAKIDKKIWQGKKKDDLISLIKDVLK